MVLAAVVTALVIGIGFWAVATYVASKVIDVSPSFIKDTPKTGAMTDRQ